MYKSILLTIMACFLFTQVSANNTGNAFKAVDAFFLAISEVDHKQMKKNVTKSFVLLEHGEVWSIDDLIDVVKPTDYKRDNYFSIINMKVYDNLVTVNYWNKANFHNENYNQNVIWLESAIIQKNKGKWRLSQMHSTRLPPGKEPKGAVFTKQKTPNQ
ncbi:MAG: hypothetical protein AB8B80_08390 [Marinicellaceae bacterium]